MQGLVGRTLGGRYALARLIGRGGSGAVFEAVDAATGAPVAVKVLQGDPLDDEERRLVVMRFTREAQAGGRLDHPNVVRVLDVGTDGDARYIVMERLTGEDLGSRLRREGRVPLGAALRIASHVLRGLEAAHAAGIVHRDLKPDNVFLVDERGERDERPDDGADRRESVVAKIVDFGTSKVARPPHGTTPLSLTRARTALGTPFYMAPEQAQARSDVDARADVYSVGAILFECLTGRPPHVGESDEQVLLSIGLNDAPAVRAFAPSVPPAAEALVARALERDRGRRFSSASAMRAAIDHLRCDASARAIVPLAPTASRRSSTSRSGASSSRRFVAIGLASLAVGAGAAALAIALVRRCDAFEPPSAAEPIAPSAFAPPPTADAAEDGEPSAPGR